MHEYALEMKETVEKQLRGCRLSIRVSIRKKLQEILDAASASRAKRGQARAGKGPPLRFYVFEGYRVSYELNPITRTVRVLQLLVEPG